MTMPSMEAAVRPRKILVVDDDRLVLATLVHGLSKAGYEVFNADNGDDAILLARQHRPELALLDIRMEGKSGFDVAAYLREQLQIPFMFLSAFADDGTVQQVRALGALAYLVKPLDIHQILPAVAQAFEQVDRRAADTPPAAATALRTPTSAPISGPTTGGLTGAATGAGSGAVAGTTPTPVPAIPHAVPLASSPAQAADGLIHPAVAGPREAPTVLAQALDAVSLAVGVLMHRGSLTRSQALTRLQQQASEEGRSLPQQAQRLLEAMELLASAR